MSQTYTFLLAGFGGQGILFLGRFLAYSGIIDNKEVSWLPSYGPAMRGGTANCSVTISDEPVGSPLVRHPQILVVLNQPSFDAFEKDVVPGGMIFTDSSLVNVKRNRNDISYFEVPSTKLAHETNMPKVGNMILLGKVLKETGVTDIETAEKALQKCTNPRKVSLIPQNIEAIKLGMSL